MEVNQSLREKAESLRQQFRIPELFIIGIDEVEPCFYVYVNKRISLIKPNMIKKIPKEWEGIPVKVKHIDKIKLA